MGSEFSLLLFLSIRLRLPLVRSPPLLIGGRPLPLLSFPPPSSPTSARRVPPLPPLLNLSLSLSTARPTHIRSPVVFLPAWCPRYSTLFLVVSPLPPSSDFPSTHVFTPTPHPPFFRLSLFQVGFFLMVSGWVWVSRLLLGLPLPWLTRRLCVCCSLSLSCSCSYLRLASLSPASPPPFSLRFWVIQRILCFLPLLVFRGVIPVSLDSSFGRGFCALLLL